ncbi:DUF1801 domain-containing protein [Thetidibacter halocola]|uniref:DUF1801 domain-containing protein n=1 Tax=Thetidibacter halocola TaxID=2827239 RepID=A0A8J7WEL2_9RHOB|nr:DUF1801 domain-containing protein [Thetidibacter halocola]MBS0123956.1 DUF1801 domain-containing protein [Thetidibacter halocola]
MADNVTRPTDASVAEFLASVEPSGRRNDALHLDTVFRRVSGWQPRLWGPSIIGYGRYDYRYASGRAGQYLATGFAPRKANMVVYIMPGYADFSAILPRLGPHRLGKSCLYLGSLSVIDEGVLAELISAGLDDLRRRWPVHPSPAPPSSSH